MDCSSWTVDETSLTEFRLYHLIVNYQLLAIQLKVLIKSYINQYILPFWECGIEEVQCLILQSIS